MAGLDRNAWFFPEGGFATQIGITGSQIDVNTGGNSLLQLHAVWNPGPVYPGGFGQTPTAWNLAGGMVMWNTMQMLYGTVEGRIKFTGTGTHPTFWLFDANTRRTNYQMAPNATTGVDHNEIDIAEGLPAIQGNTTTLRFNTFAAGGGNSVSNVAGFTDYSSNFHTYKVVWTPTSVTFFVDGVQQFQTTTNIPNHPMYLVMDIECGDAGAGAVSQANFPGAGQVYQVDYVKAWDSNNNLIFYDEFDGNPAFQSENMANLTFIQGKSAIGASGTSFGLAYTSNTTSQSWLLALGLVGTTSAVTLSITDSLGNTWQQVGSNFLLQNNTVAVFQVPANKIGGGANTVTLHSTVSATLVLVLGEYSGQNLTSPVDSFATAQWASTAASIGPINTHQTNEALVAIAWLADTIAATGADGTIRLNAGGATDGLIEDRSLATPGSYTASWTNGANGGGGMVLGVITTSSVAASGGWVQGHRSFVNKRGSGRLR